MSDLAQRIFDPIVGLPKQPTPQEVLTHAVDLFGHIAISSSLGPQTVVLIDMLHKLQLDVPVFLLDTGFLFPETLELRERIQQKYGIEIQLIAPDQSVEDQEAEFGELYKTDSNACCRKRKVVPLNRALNGLDAWITGLRRDMSKGRSNVEAIDWDNHHGLWKVNPLADWSREQVFAYIADNDVPTNPLLEHGFKSIGCWPCTRAVRPGDDERSGRWAGQAKDECGIHTGQFRAQSGPVLAGGGH